MSCNFPISITGLAYTICLNASSANLVGSPAGGTFTIDGISGTVFNPSAAGIGSHQIIYTYSSSAACIKSDTAIVLVDVCGSINNLNNESSMEIYPNPADEFLIIKNSFTGNETATVKFFDVAGKEIFSSQLKTSNQKLETRNLENGIYFCQLKSYDKIFNQKFIVQH
ncbi:MAG: T9SS type A sorting domain-containing protein [Bacteroidota bacterium]